MSKRASRIGALFSPCSGNYGFFGGKKRFQGLGGKRVWSWLARGGGPEVPSTPDFLWFCDWSLDIRALVCSVKRLGYMLTRFLISKPWISLFNQSFSSGCVWMKFGCGCCGFCVKLSTAVMYVACSDTLSVSGKIEEHPVWGPRTRQMCECLKCLKVSLALLWAWDSRHVIRYMLLPWAWNMRFLVSLMWHFQSWIYSKQLFYGVVLNWTGLLNWLYGRSKIFGIA